MAKHTLTPSIHSELTTRTYLKTARFINRFHPRIDPKTEEITARFFKRFHPRIEFQLRNVVMNNNQDMLRKFTDAIQGRTVIQLYHCVNQYGYSSVQEIAESIFRNGFRIGQASNKGYGVYLASHSNYAQYWAGNNHAIVCDVIVDETRVGKYYSEIYSPENNWEYCVANPDLIYPKCYIEYERIWTNTHYERLWTNAICPTCPAEKHEQKEHQRRCDCRQYPTADTDDIIYDYDVSAATISART